MLRKVVFGYEYTDPSQFTRTRQGLIQGYTESQQQTNWVTRKKLRAHISKKDKREPKYRMWTVVATIITVIFFFCASYLCFTFFSPRF